jgi:hypothetical protein
MIKIITQALLIGLLGISTQVGVVFAEHSVNTSAYENSRAELRLLSSQPVPKHFHNPHASSSPALTAAILSQDIEISARKPLAGYGACAISGCPCQGFVDSYGSDLCGNCGHKYSDHW